MIILVTRNDSDLERRVWAFRAGVAYDLQGGGVRLSLVRHARQRRASKRHKWRDSAVASREFTGTIWVDDYRRSLPTPSLPEDVAAEAVAIVRSSVHVEAF